MPYYVRYADCTHDEPTPGWYYVGTDEDGKEALRGPFSSKSDALDDQSDGAYSAYLEAQRESDYEHDMLDAGRGHLLPRDR